MAAMKEDVKAGCSNSACSCKEATVDVKGKKCCSTSCADNKNPCVCGHAGCKPKK